MAKNNGNYHLKTAEQIGGMTQAIADLRADIARLDAKVDAKLASHDLAISAINSQISYWKGMQALAGAVAGTIASLIMSQLRR